MNEDDDVEETIGAWLVEAFPAPLVPGGLTALDPPSPIRLDKSPPLNNAATEGVQTIEGWKFVRVGTGRPPGDSVWSISGREVSPDPRTISKLECDVLVEQGLEPGFVDLDKITIDVVFCGEELGNFLLGVEMRIGRPVGGFGVRI